MEEEIESLKARIEELEERLDYAYIAIVALNQMFVEKGLATEEQIQSLHQRIFEDSMQVNEGTE